MKTRADNLLAVDLGASNGRIMLGRLHDQRLTLEMVHRFEHSPTQQAGHLRWDWPIIIASLNEGLHAAAELTQHQPIVSVSCDSWAQDFGLLDQEGALLFSPISYRDSRTAGMPASFSDIITPHELLQRVGAVLSPLTTLCQLRAMALQEPALLDDAATLLHVADLAHYELCGAGVTDRTMSTVSQLRNLAGDEWDRALLESLAIPHHFLPQIVEAPAIIGHVPEDHAPHPGLAGVPVVVSASHDTAAATELLSSADGNVAFLSCGTWSMLGCVGDELPVVPEAAREELFLVGLARGRWGLFRGMTGLWLLQECRRTWAAQGHELSLDELAATVERCPQEAQAIINPDDARFTAPADMPAEIRRFCIETGQPAPETPADVSRIILTSLALDYRMGIETLEVASGTQFEALRIVSGGSANERLCQLAADVTGLPVSAGPVEATAIGNVLLQAGVRQLLDANDIPTIAANSFPVKCYQPRRHRDEALCARFRELKEGAAT